MNIKLQQMKLQLLGAHKLHIQPRFIAIFWEKLSFCAVMDNKDILTESLPNGYLSSFTDLF